MPNTRLDPTKIVSGYQGELYDGAGAFLAAVPKWQAQIALTNTDYQPAGQLLEVAILQKYRVSLTFEETVFQDMDFLAKVLAALSGTSAGNAGFGATPPQGPQTVNGVLYLAPVFSFQGKLIRSDGQFGYYAFTNVVPDGNVDIANVQPGDVLKRNWSWRVNDPVNVMALLGNNNSGGVL